MACDERFDAWEAEVDRMRQEFFSRSSISEKEPDPAEAVKHKSIRTEVEDTPNGGKKLKVKFFVDDFEPDELKVRTEGHKLVVQGSREARKGNRTEKKEFKREYVLPDSVSPNDISSFLSPDGTLTIEAPLPAPPPPLLEGPIVEDMDGRKKIRLQYDVHMFTPSEVSVTVEGNLLKVYAFHKEATGSSNVVVHREFKREFNLPDPVDRNNIQYSIVNGILTIEAALIRPSQPGSLLVSERSPSIQSESDRVLHLKFDVGKFLPEEISVKCVANLLKVQAVHEEDQDGSTVRREYTRNCQLPETADVDRMTSTLDEFGRLTVEVPLLAPKQKEKVIKVQLKQSDSSGSSRPK